MLYQTLCTYNKRLKIFLTSRKHQKFMEFPYSLSKYLTLNEQGFLICTGRTISHNLNPIHLNEATKIFHSILNELGERSAKSQALKQVITTAIKFQGSDHRIYIKVQGNKAIGFMRTGQKKLFYHDQIGKIKELTPTCVLDIYVHENYQRSGIGKEIFQTFLHQESKTPEKLAYDRPSPKLISFLKKHYGLSKFIPQNNNFVIFDQYFTGVGLNKNKSKQQSSDTKVFKQQLHNNEFNQKKQKKPQEQKQMLVQQKYSNVHNPLFRGYRNQKRLPLSRVQEPLKNRQNTTFDQTKALMEQKSGVEQKQLGNKTFSKNFHHKKEEIEDSLSLLEKEMNKKQMRTTFATHQSQQVGKEDGNLLRKASNNKLQSYGCPWAIEQNISFRTTSNSYGSYYQKLK